MPLPKRAKRPIAWPSNPFAALEFFYRIGATGEGLKRQRRRQETKQFFCLEKIITAPRKRLCRVVVLGIVNAIIIVCASWTVSLGDDNGVSSRQSKNSFDRRNGTLSPLAKRSPIVVHTLMEQGDGNHTHQYRHTPLLCPIISCKNCRQGHPAIPRASIDSHNSCLTKTSTFYSGNWGNVLSPYWAARAIAELGGYAYSGGKFGAGTWMEFLPTSAPMRVPRKELFDQTCKLCSSYEFFHIGTCGHGWAAMGSAIGEDTRNALVQHSMRYSTPKSENDAIFNFFKPNDWLVYNRCCVFGHGEHGPGVLRMYDVIPSEGEFSVYIMTGRKEDPFDLCMTLIEESKMHLQRKNPLANVRILEKSTPYVDFARLVFAPQVLVAGVGSSWALWSAVMANNNTVAILPPSFSNFVGVFERDGPLSPPDSSSLKYNDLLPDNIQILETVPSLRNPAVSNYSATEYGIPFGKFSNSSSDREKVFAYFRTA